MFLWYWSLMKYFISSFLGNYWHFNQTEPFCDRVFYHIGSNEVTSARIISLSLVSKVAFFKRLCYTQSIKIQEIAEDPIERGRDDKNEVAIQQ